MSSAFASSTASPNWPVTRAALIGIRGLEDLRHLQALVEHKRQARAHRGCDALARVAPAASELLQMAALRGYGLGGITTELLRLLDQYGAPALQAALLEAVRRDVPHPNAVRLALERERERAGRPPALALALPEHVARRQGPRRGPCVAHADAHAVAGLL